MNQLIRKAVQSATATVHEGDEPFGMVLVNNGEIISEGVNELQTCFLYTSSEPLPIGLPSLDFSQMTGAYYSGTVGNTAEVETETSNLIYKDLAKSNVNRILMMKYMPLETGQENLMKMWDKQYENG